MKKQVVAALLFMLLVSSFSFAAEDGWTPRIPNYDTSWIDQFSILWLKAWKFFAAF